MYGMHRMYGMYEMHGIIHEQQRRLWVRRWYITLPFVGLNVIACPGTE